MRRFWNRTWLLALSALFLGCGSSSGDQPRDPKNPRLAEVPKPDGRWNVIAKSCDGKMLAVKVVDTYVFASGVFVHIERHSDSASQRCDIGHIYQQILSGFSSGDDSYEETAVLRPFQTKRVCRAKVNGRVQGEPTLTEILDWNAPLRGLSLVMDRNDFQISLQGSEECSGLLKLKLKFDRP